MSEGRTTNRQFWIAIGLISVFVGASLILKTVVDEMTKPVYDIPTVDRENPYTSVWSTE